MPGQGQLTTEAFAAAYAHIAPGAREPDKAHAIAGTANRLFYAVLHLDASGRAAHS